METLLTDDLWRRNAEHADRMARLLEQEVKKIPRVKIVYPVEANGVFAQIPQEAIEKIQGRYFFYVWSEEESVVRWMCSFDTTEEDVREVTEFVAAGVEEGLDLRPARLFLFWWPYRRPLVARRHCDSPASP